MKAKYRIWHLPILSFYSKRFYRDVSSRWKGTNLGYLCVMLAICLIPAARNAGKLAEQIINEKAELFLMQIPPMQVEDGRLTVDAPQPYSIIDGNHTVLLIDTTGAINNLQQAGALTLLTQTEFHLQQQGQAPLIVPLSEFRNMELDQGIASAIVARTREIFVPVFYGLTYLASLILLVLAAMICSVIAMVFATMQSRDVNYSAGLRLSVLALTPPTLLSGALEAANQTIPFFLYALLALTYLYMAVGAARKSTSSELYLDNERIGQ